MKQKTEDQVIIEHTRRWFENSRESIESFSTTLLIPALEDAGLAEVDHDSVENSVEAFKKWRRAASMRVGRIIRGQKPFPLAWKWFWIGCLPHDYQIEVRRELIAMAGSFYVPLPKIGLAPGADPVAAVEAVKATLHRVSQEFGELQAHSQPAHDGRYDVNDDPLEVDRMMKEAGDLVEALLGEMTALAQGTGRPMPRLRMIAIDMGE